MNHVTASENYTVSVVRRLSAKGDRDAIVAGERRITGTEAAGAVLRFAAVLREFGLREGDGVALFVENFSEALLLQVAVHFAGCRLVFVPPEPGNSELEALIRRADVKRLLFDPDLEERTRRIVEGTNVPHVLAIGASALADDFLSAASGVGGLSLDEAADGRHLATLLYTGGTTGVPKLVVHRSSFYGDFARVADTYADEASSGALLVCTLLTHSSGHGGFLVGILSGHTVVLLRTFDAGEALAAMERERVTRVVLVTPMLYELLDHPDCVPGRFPALTTLTYTGAAASPERLKQALACFGPVLHQIYGATEDGRVTQLDPEEHDPRRPGTLTSCGRPAPGVEVELRDEEGKPVPVGEPGELYVRSSTVMQGYWNDPERTAEVLDDEGWFRTGDIARRDENGYLYLVDRARDIIVTGTTADNVYSRLLDDFLAAQPGIKEAAAIGLPGDEQGDRQRGPGAPGPRRRTGPQRTDAADRRRAGGSLRARLLRGDRRPPAHRRRQDRQEGAAGVPAEGRVGGPAVPSAQPSPAVMRGRGCRRDARPG
ncbi:AMP-binding protein [Streptomyces albus]|uniref:AMP-binding protein n=1 Tax=Streptomyces sp. NRRL F-5639 TaxID=1463867 RepID=UPI000691E610|nr:AMP-binding protein [Streptomyces sp. NRRL F-5639]